MRTRRKTPGLMPATVSTATMLLLSLPVLFMWQFSYGQSSEFPEHNNGLIYSEQAVDKLKFIVDSLNLKFKVCELQKTYLSRHQARAHYVRLEKSKNKEAIADLERHILPDDFIKKYPEAKLDKDLLVVKSRYTGYDEKETVEFRSVPFNNKGEYVLSFTDNPEVYTQEVKGRWIICRTDSEVRAFYFPEGFRQQPLPLPYARMVQYSDCMVDTSTLIFLNTSANFGNYPAKRPKALTMFLSYVHQQTGKPMPDKRMSESYWKKYEQWESRRTALVDNKLARQEEFQKLLAVAVPAALAEGGSDDEFEEYVARYYNKAAALELKRSRRVIGNCSMDDSPRVHALNIAQLSAETVHWQTFLRAHLDIMNDRFERASDGSYAWAARKTYIRELEVLDINVPDLLFGISLRIENPDRNHYYGNVGRLGRALTESAQAAEMEKAMLATIEDQELDNYNRVLMYYLFLNYNFHLEDENRKRENIRKLNEAVKAFPAYLAARATVKE